MRASKNVPISSSSRLSSSSVSQTARRRNSPIERRLSFRRIRIRRAGSFASSVYAPPARLHARVRALGRGVRDHSSLSRGQRRRGCEPLCSRSRCVVMDVIHSLIHSFIHSRRAPCRPRVRDSFRGRVTPPLASPRHLDERVDSGARDSSRRAAKTNRHEKMRGARERGEDDRVYWRLAGDEMNRFRTPPV